MNNELCAYLFVTLFVATFLCLTHRVHDLRLLVPYIYTFAQLSSKRAELRKCGYTIDHLAIANDICQVIWQGHQQCMSATEQFNLMQLVQCIEQMFYLENNLFRNKQYCISDRALSTNLRIDAQSYLDNLLTVLRPNQFAIMQTEIARCDTVVQTLIANPTIVASLWTDRLRAVGRQKHLTHLGVFWRKCDRRNRLLFVSFELTIWNKNIRFNEYLWIKCLSLSTHQYSISTSLYEQTTFWILSHFEIMVKCVHALKMIE